MGTINNKSFKEVLEQLREPFPESELEYKMDKYPYFPIEVYEDRINEVIGFFNYDLNCQASKLMRINGGWYLSKIGTLTIYDDDRNIVKRITVGAGTPIIIVEKTGNALNIGNDEKTLDCTVLKNALKIMGVGSTQLRELKKKSKKPKETYAQDSRTVASQNKVGNTEKTGTYEIVFQKALSAMSRGYKTSVSAEDSTYELVIWQDGITSIERYLNMGDFCKMAVPGAKCLIKGFFKSYQGKMQLVMVELVKNK